MNDRPTNECKYCQAVMHLIDGGYYCASCGNSLAVRAVAGPTGLNDGGIKLMPMAGEYPEPPPPPEPPGYTKVLG